MWDLQPQPSPQDYADNEKAIAICRLPCPVLHECYLAAEAEKATGVVMAGLRWPLRSRGRIFTPGACVWCGEILPTPRLSSMRYCDEGCRRTAGNERKRIKVNA
jgi:hypothetical protein